MFYKNIIIGLFFMGSLPIKTFQLGGIETTYKNQSVTLKFFEIHNNICVIAYAQNCSGHSMIKNTHHQLFVLKNPAIKEDSHGLIISSNLGTHTLNLSEQNPRKRLRD